MSTAKKQYCFNCGAFLGEYKHWPGDIESCGSRECEREARNQIESEHADRAERAAQDEYQRYGF